MGALNASTDVEPEREDARVSSVIKQDNRARGHEKRKERSMCE
jgi:hypothetical protein